MKRMIFVLLFFGPPLFARADTAQVGGYEAALKLYQEQKYSESEQQFRGFAAHYPQNKFVHYNWGLAAYQSGLKGLALAAWRRALTLDPDFTPARDAMRFARTEMPSEVFSATANRWEALRSDVLEQTTLDRFFGLTLLLFFFSAALWLRYLGARYRALRDELPLPPFPTIGTLFAGGFVIVAGLCIAKYVADGELRATVIKTGVTVRSGPSAQDNSLFEIIEGAQVIVRQAQSGWTMVTYPGGLSGWVPSETIFITSQRD